MLTRRLLLTGDTIEAAEVAHLGVFTEVVEPDEVTARAAWYAEKASRMPGDGIVLAKEAFRLIEQLSAYQGEEVLSPLLHAYGTNLQFGEGEFNFVKARAEHGTKRGLRAPRRPLRGPRALTPRSGGSPVLLRTRGCHQNEADQLPPVASTASGATSRAQR